MKRTTFGKSLGDDDSLDLMTDGFTIGVCGPNRIWNWAAANGLVNQSLLGCDLFGVGRNPTKDWDATVPLVAMFATCGIME